MAPVCSEWGVFWAWEASFSLKSVLAPTLDGVRTSFWIFKSEPEIVFTLVYGLVYDLTLLIGEIKEFLPVLFELLKVFYAFGNYKYGTLVTTAPFLSILESL